MDSYFKKIIEPDIIDKVHVISEDISENLMSSLKQKTTIISPSIEYCNNALILPGKSCDKVWVEDLVYSSDLKPIESAKLKFARFSPIRKRNSILNNSKSLQEKNVEHINKCVYCGVLFAHFGHFLTESLSRLWILNKNTIIPNDIIFVFHAHHPNIDLNHLKRTKFMDYFILLGIQDQIKIVEKPIKCNELLIPGPALHLATADGIQMVGSLQMKSFWNHIKEQAISCNLDIIAKKRKKLYFSRSNLKKSVQNRKLLNEKKLEQYLEDEGFEIIYPHDLSSEKEKIQLLAQADVLMGLNGTGLLNAAFMNDGTKVIQLVNLNYNSVVQVQSGLCFIKDIELHSIVVGAKDEGPEWSIDINKVSSVLTKLNICKK